MPSAIHTPADLAKVESEVGSAKRERERERENVDGT